MYPKSLWILRLRGKNVAGITCLVVSWVLSVQFSSISGQEVIAQITEYRTTHFYVIEGQKLLYCCVSGSARTFD